MFEYEDFISRAARRKLSLSDDHSIHKFQVVNDDNLVVEISKSRIIEKGKRKGQLTWKDKKGKWISESKVAVISQKDIQHERKVFESEEGRCYNCSGNGEMVIGWSRTEGQRTEKCHRCNGSGEATKSPTVT